MTLEDSYKLLELRPGAGIEDVKKAFRRLAFSLHPDLNPRDPRAKGKFQQINEAYVLLKHYIEDDTAGQAGQARQKAKAGAKAEAQAEAASEAHRKKAKAAYQQAAESASGDQTLFYFRREEVLQDLLKDPFARQVFEDIYRQAHTAAPKRPAKQVTQKELKLSWGDAKVSFDLSEGIWGGVKSLLLGQLDDEQIVHVAAARLTPGAKVRVNIAYGLSDKPVTVEVTLPPDFTVGKPVRLKGMGRRIGPWKGDLFLRLAAK
ncbi:MAG: J domain-containing protein [Desulfovibrionaceae bacterium]|nr:J domain-containing protein [Desulfovibrionaceae bacterium]MBF0513813.1 J domain-containing protein [Desulfovibrionaceae bacterium]